MHSRFRIPMVKKTQAKNWQVVFSTIVFNKDPDIFDPLLHKFNADKSFLAGPKAFAKI